MDNRGDWIQTYTGERFYPLDPRPEEVHAADIAHALSNICRFNGHSNRFYSVAEHSYILSQVCSPEHALWALLHDAAEAYICDLPRPTKHQIPRYAELEKVILMAIAVKFKLHILHPEHLYPEQVSVLDTRLLLNERAKLMPNTRFEWGIDHLTPLDGVKIVSYYPEDAEVLILQRLEELGIEV